MAQLVTLFDKPNYGGVSVNLGVGNYPLSKDWSAGLGRDANNWVSSMKVPAGMKATLYENQNYSGKTLAVTQDIADLNSYGFHDIMSSVKIEEVAATTPKTVVTSNTPAGGASTPTSPGSIATQVIDAAKQVVSGQTNGTDTGGAQPGTNTGTDTTTKKKISTGVFVAIIAGVLLVIGTATYFILRNKNNG